MENTYTEKPAARTMRVLREELRMARSQGAASSQAVVEGEVALPGGLREETRVLSAEAAAVVDKASAMSDRVDVDGKVVFHVLYTQGDPTRVLALEANADYTHALPMAGVSPRMDAAASATAENVTAEAKGGRLLLRAVLRVNASVLSEEPVSVVTGLSDLDGLMLKTCTLPTCVTAARGTGEALIREEFELPEVLRVRETLYATAAALVTDVTGGEERATISGEIQLEALHVSDLPGRPLVVTRHAIPFEESIGLAGARGDTLTCDAAVKDVAVLSQDAGDDSRVMRAETLLALSAAAVRQADAVALADAYATGGDALTLATGRMRTVRRFVRGHTAESGKTTLALPEDARPARTVLKAFLRPVVTARESAAGRTTVDGVMEATVLYMSDDGETPASVSMAEPFQMTFAIATTPEDDARLLPLNVDASLITSDRIECRYIAHLFVDGVEAEEDAVVTDVTREDAPPAATGVVLAFAQAGETLWDIARRYRAPQSALRRVREGTEPDAPLQEGEGVILWRRG